MEHVTKIKSANGVSWFVCSCGIVGRENAYWVEAAYDARVHRDYESKQKR